MSGWIVLELLPWDRLGYQMRVICSWDGLFDFAFSKLSSDKFEEIYRHTRNVEEDSRKTSSERKEVVSLGFFIVPDTDTLYPVSCLWLRTGRPNRTI
jgi:hypothetical protein